MPERRQSLRHKLLLWLLVPLLVFYVGRATYTYYFASDLADRIYDRTLYTLTRALVQQIDIAPGQQGARLSEAAHDILRADDYDHIFFVVRGDNAAAIIGDSRIPTEPDPPKCGDYCYYNAMHDGTQVRVLSMRWDSDQDSSVVNARIYVAETLNKRAMLTRDVIENVLMPQILTIILVAVVIWFGVGKGLTPLNRLKEAVSQRSHLDLRPLDEAGAPTEARPLVHAINDLMQRLAAVLDAQNRFIADAAHQLRTPLAGLKTQIEYALREPDRENTRHAVEQAYVSADRLTRLVNQLLTLARHEPAADKMLKRVPTDIVELASEATMEWVPEALKKGIDLGMETDDQHISLLCDSVRLREFINNLLDNAIRYTPEQGRVTLRITGGSINPVLTVQDNGPGIPPEDRERIFERFYRVLGNGEDGSGLGLAIVKDIARAHGWEVSANPVESGQGTVIRVEFKPEGVGRGERI